LKAQKKCSPWEIARMNSLFAMDDEISKMCIWYLESKTPNKIVQRRFKLENYPLYNREEVFILVSKWKRKNNFKDSLLSMYNQKKLDKLSPKSDIIWPLEFFLNTKKMGENGWNCQIVLKTSMSNNSIH